MATSIPLAPGQIYNLSRGIEFARRDNAVFIFDLEQRVIVELLKKAVGSVIESHEEFRYRFSQIGDTWRQTLSTKSEQISAFEFHPIKVDSPNALSDILSLEVAHAQTHISIEHGSLVRAVLVEFGHSGDQKLIIVLNHLISDYISTKIFINELARTYLALCRGEPLEIRKQSAGFKEWCRLYWSRAEDSEAAMNVARYFDSRTLSASTDASIFRGSAQGCEGPQYSVVTTCFDERMTRELFQACYRKYGVWMNVVLLTGLSICLSSDMKSGELPIWIQESGRTVPVGELDLATKIGYFSYATILFLPICGELTLAEIAPRVHKAYQDVQRFGYDVNVALFSRDDVQTTYGSLSPHIWFNYMGDDLRSFNNRQLLGEYKTISSETFGSEGFATLGLIANVVAGKLFARWEYCRDAFPPRYVEGLAARFKRACEQLL